MNSRFVKMCLLTFKQMKDPYYQGFAAQISFYFTLSLVPTLIVLTQILGILDISLDFMKEWINTYVAPGMAPMLKDMVTSSAATTTNLVLVAMAIWAASRAQFSLMRIANYTYSSGKTTGRFWKERIRSMKTMIINLVTFAVVAIIFVYGKMIFSVLVGKIIEESVLNMLWTYFRWPLAGGLYFLTVSNNYYSLPLKKMKFREILPGSLFGAVGMLVVTIVYSSYVNFSVNYDIIYGSLASFVALLFWFYFLSWALCLGIVVNKVWKDTKN